MSTHLLPEKGGEQEVCSSSHWGGTTRLPSMAALGGIIAYCVGIGKKNRSADTAPTRVMVNRCRGRCPQRPVGNALVSGGRTRRSAPTAGEGGFHVLMGIDKKLKAGIIMNRERALL